MPFVATLQAMPSGVIRQGSRRPSGESVPVLLPMRRTLEACEEGREVFAGGVLAAAGLVHNLVEEPPEPDVDARCGPVRRSRRLSQRAAQPVEHEAMPAREGVV
mgnify:CR=1 FL=1